MLHTKSWGLGLGRITRPVPPAGNAAHRHCTNRVCLVEHVHLRSKSRLTDYCESYYGYGYSSHLHWSWNCSGRGCVAAHAFLRKDQGVLGEHTLEITDDGLIELTEVNRSLYNWRTTFRILETRNYAYVYISATHAHIVPKNPLPIDGSVDDFLAALRARFANCKHGNSIG